MWPDSVPAVRRDTQRVQRLRKCHAMPMSSSVPCLCSCGVASSRARPCSGSPLAVGGGAVAEVKLRVRHQVGDARARRRRR
jgi:hypothetical protein